MTTQVPSFLLKGVDPVALLAAYRSGTFRVESPESRAPIKIVQNISVVSPTYETSNTGAVFAIRDKHNFGIVLATSNHRNFEVFTRTNGELPLGGRCDYCKVDFPHQAVGYPLAYEERIVLTTQPEKKEGEGSKKGGEQDSVGRYRVIYVFWVEGEFCTFECALGFVQRMISRPSGFRDGTLIDSERLLKFLHMLTHPRAPPLVAAKDPRLHKNNGGSLTEEEYRDPRHIYYRTERVLLIPAKVEYVRYNLAASGVKVEKLLDAPGSLD